MAETLAALWRPADGIAPWLSKYEPRLTKLVRVERWTWRDVARALTAAGITYETGRPWSENILSVRITEARNRRRKAREQRQAERAERQARSQSPPVSHVAPLPTAAAVPQPVTEQPSCDAENMADLERERLRAKFGTGSTLRNSKSAEPQPTAQPVAPATEPQPRSEQEVDAMIARMMGKPAANRP